MALIVVFIFIIFDVVTGWLKALSTRTTSSTIMREGLFHKLAEIIAILFGYTCEYVFPYAGIEVSIPLATGIATYIVIMETASIVENLGVMNPALGNILSKFFNKKEPDTEGEKSDENESADSTRSDNG